MNLQLDNSNVDASSNSRQQDRPSVKKDVSKMIWVIVGKTEHQAWLAEDTIEGKEKVFIEWQSTGRREQVPASSIRFGIPRQRRRTSRAEINVKSFDGAAYGTGDGEDDEKNKKVKKNAPRKKKKATASQMASSEKKRKRNASESASGAVESSSEAIGSSGSGDESVTAKNTKHNGDRRKNNSASGNKVGPSMSKKKLGSSGNNDKENRKRRRTASGEIQVMTSATTADRPHINVSDKSYRQTAYEANSEPTRKEGTGNEAQITNDGIEKTTSVKLTGGKSAPIASKGQLGLSSENDGNTRNSEQSPIENPTTQTSAAHLEGAWSITNNLMDNASDNRASQVLNSPSGTFMKVDSARLKDKLGNRLSPSEGEYLEPSHSLAKISMEGRASAPEDQEVGRTDPSRTFASDIAKSTVPPTGESYGEKVSRFNGAVASTLYGSNCMKMPDRQDVESGVFATGTVNSGIPSATTITDPSMGNKDIRTPIAHVETAKSSTFLVEQLRPTNKQPKPLSASSGQVVSSARDSALIMHTGDRKNSASSKSEKTNLTSSGGKKVEIDPTTVVVGSIRAHPTMGDSELVAGANTNTELSSDAYGNSKNDTRSGKKSGGHSLDIESDYKSPTADGRNAKTLLGWSGGESLKTKATLASTLLTARFLNEGTSKDPVVDGKPKVATGSLPQASGTESSRKSNTRQGQVLSSDNSKSTKTTKRRAPAGLQHGERCMLKPIWPAFFSVSPGQYDVKFSKDGMDLFQECLYEDIANLLEDVRVMKQEEVDSILDAK